MHIHTNTREGNTTNTEEKNSFFLIVVFSLVVLSLRYLLLFSAVSRKTTCNIQIGGGGGSALIQCTEWNPKSDENTEIHFAAIRCRRTEIQSTVLCQTLDEREREKRSNKNRDFRSDDQCHNKQTLGKKSHQNITPSDNRSLARFMCSWSMWPIIHAYTLIHTIRIHTYSSLFVSFSLSHFGYQNVWRDFRLCQYIRTQHARIQAAATRLCPAYNFSMIQLCACRADCSCRTI